MRTRILGCFALLGISTVAQAGAMVRMMATTPPNGLDGGYAPGTIVDVDVYLSQDPGGNSFDLRHLQLDFVASSPELLLIPPLTHSVANVRVWNFTEPGGNCVTGGESTCGAGHHFDSQFTQPPLREKVVSMTYFFVDPSNLTSDPAAQRAVLAVGETLIARIQVAMPDDQTPLCYNLDALNEVKANPDLGGAELRFGFGTDVDGVPLTTWRVGYAPPNDFRSANTGPGGSLQLCVNAAPDCDPANTCNGNGVCNAAGGCDCDSGYLGLGCDQCAPGLYDFPNCISCAAATTCSGNGVCNVFGLCDCLEGYAGAACDQCAANHYGYPSCVFCEPATTCSGHGICTDSGACSCAQGFAGPACSQCAPSYYGYPSCVFCDSATTCSGNGACSEFGSCDCDAEFGGLACDQCLPNYYRYPICLFCAPATTCSGNGSCDGLGQCDCLAEYAGANCDQCAPDHFGYPACVFCDSAITCGGHGLCNDSGECVCDPGFSGPHCEEMPIPAASEWGLAVLALVLLIVGKLRFNTGALRCARTS